VVEESLRFKFGVERPAGALMLQPP
jgi:hypothetical protein